MSKYSKTIVLLLTALACANSQESHWRQTNGPYGGSITALALNSQGYIIAGTLNGGVFLSKDSGKRWYNILRTPCFVGDVAVDSDDAIYVSLHEDGLYRTTDNGEHWLKVNNGQSIDFVAFGINREVLVGSSEDDLQISSDSCVTWQRVSQQRTDFMSCLVVNPKGRIFYGRGEVEGDNKIYMAAPDATSWREIDVDYSGRPVACLAVSESGTLIASLDEMDGVGDLYRSSDDGKHWVKLPTNFKSSYVGCMAYDRKGTLFVGTRENGVDNALYASGDNGSSWSEVHTDLVAPAMRSIIFDRSGGIFIGTDEGILASFDGGATWRSKNEGIAALEITSLCIIPHDTIIVGSEDGRIFRSWNFGVDWEEVGNVEPGAKVQALATNARGDLLASTDNGKAFGGSVYRSSDRGMTWEQTNLAFASASPIVFTDTSRAISIVYNDEFRKGKIFESIDYGKGWKPVRSELGDLFISDLYQVPGGMLFASRHTDYNSSRGIVVRSSDGGVNWDSVATFDRYITTLVSKEYIICVSVGTSRVAISTDKGEHFATYGIGHDTVISSLFIVSSDTIYAGCEDGIYLSTNLGKTWIKSANVKVTHTKAFVEDSRGDVFVATSTGVGRLTK